MFINGMMHNALSPVKLNSAESIAHFMQNARMDKKDSTKIQGARLRQAREAMFSTALQGHAHVKKFSDVAASTYTLHENGTRGFKARADEYGRAFNVSPEWLLWGTSNSGKAIEIPVAGKVAAGMGGDFYSDYSPGDGGEPVTFNPGDISLVLEISGDSMAPRYRDREKVLFGYQHADPSAFLRKEVFVQTRSGQKLFKQLRKGSRQGLWDLYSINPEFDPIRDVEIDWVAPVEWHRVLV